MLARVAHKHASLGITEDQYPIVHEHLFEAIVEVLGDAVTPEVASAWDEVYWRMAGALVTIEKRLYAETDVADGDVWRTLVLKGRLQESPDTVSFVIGTADRSALPVVPSGWSVGPGTTQNWGQIPKAIRGILATEGEHPGDACNGHTGFLSGP